MSAVPGRAPSTGGTEARQEPIRYVGFWARCLAALVDTIAVSFVIAPLAVVFDVHSDIGPHFDLSRVFNETSLMSFTLNWVLPAVAILAFWFSRGATPGKMVISAVIVDADTLEPPTRAKLVARYLAYYVSTLAIGLGFLWIAFDARKQGWHDKIAGTVVIRKPR
jgi:uncharacterized RDD family membrane protein YckC